MEQFIIDVINSFSGNPYFQLVTAVIALASAICAVTPTPPPDTFWGKVYKVIEVLAINVGKAKDKSN